MQLELSNRRMDTPMHEPVKILDPILDVQGLTLYYGAV
jgi:hypothetical protein